MPHATVTLRGRFMIKTVIQTTGLRVFGARGHRGGMARCDHFSRLYLPIWYKVEEISILRVVVLEWLKGIAWDDG